MHKKFLSSLVHSRESCECLTAPHSQNIIVKIPQKVDIKILVRVAIPRADSKTSVFLLLNFYLQRAVAIEKNKEMQSNQLVNVDIIYENTLNAIT